MYDTRARWWRLKRTGPGNANYRRGKWTRYRRHRLEASVIEGMSQLMQFTTILPKLMRLPAEKREQLHARFGLLTEECHPNHWALQDTRRGVRRNSWYIPRVAWTYAAAWLRSARECIRLIVLAKETINQSITPVLQKRIERLEQGVNHARVPVDETLRRYRIWCASQGLPPPDSATP